MSVKFERKTDEPFLYFSIGDIMKKTNRMETKMDNIFSSISHDSLFLSLPTKNLGKFRWKTRENFFGFGKGFATTTIPFTEKAYLEWQIGYDSEVDSEKKTSSLSFLTFFGANGKQKCPYELAEILAILSMNKLLPDGQSIPELICEIRGRNYFFDENFQIQTDDKEEKEIEGFRLFQQNTVLPTFSYGESPSSPSIEISIEKQQYATGVQPMVYLTIPLPSFFNFNDLINKTSREISCAKWELKKTNSKMITDLFRFFGLCSFKHKHDILEILKLINEMEKKL